MSKDSFPKSLSPSATAIQNQLIEEEKDYEINFEVCDDNNKNFSSTNMASNHLSTPIFQTQDEKGNNIAYIPAPLEKP